MSFSYVELPACTLEVSLVIPVRDEAENVVPLADEIDRALEEGGWRWECVWVDDGSRDGTLSNLEGLRDGRPRHRVVSLERRYGKAAALAVGFGRARGEILVTLDGDGQIDPADIPKLLTTLAEECADVVNGRRVGRQDGWVRKISSRMGNAFRNALTGAEVTDVGCSLRAFRRECVGGLLVFRGMQRFLPTLMRLNGAGRRVEIPVSHRPRLHGQTKYGIGNRLWVGICDTLAVRWMMRRSVRPQVKTALTVHERSAPAVHNEESQR